MRFILTCLLGGLFVLFFSVATLTHSVIGFVSDTNAVVVTLREAGTYTGVKEAFAHRLQGAPPPESASPEERKLSEKLKAGLARTLTESVSEDAFYTMVGSWHAGLVGLVTQGADASLVDLTVFKSKLHAYLKGFDAQNEAAGVGLPAEAITRVSLMETTIHQGIETVPDSCSVSQLLAKAGAGPARIQTTFETVHRNLALIHALALSLVFVAGGILLLVFLINIGSLRRMLLRTGFVLLIASALYALVEHRGEALFLQPVEKAFFHDTDGAMGRSTERSKLWAAFSPVLVHATGHADRWVYSSMAAGLLLCVAGFARRANPGAQPVEDRQTKPVA